MSQPEPDSVGDCSAPGKFTVISEREKENSFFSVSRWLQAMASNESKHTEPAYLTIKELSDRSRISVTQLHRMVCARQIDFF